MVGLLKSNAPTLSLTYPKTLSKTRIPKLAPRIPQPQTHFFAAFATGL